MSTLSRTPFARIAFVVGATIVLLALALAEFVTFPAAGHWIDTTKWPTEAQAILRENPGTSISSEQWRRIDAILRSAGDMNYGQRPYWAQTVRASWWWFVLLPLAAALVIRLKLGSLPAKSAMLLAGPSAALLLLSLALTGGAT